MRTYAWGCQLATVRMDVDECAVCGCKHAFPLAPTWCLERHVFMGLGFGKARLHEMLQRISQPSHHKRTSPEHYRTSEGAPNPILCRKNKHIFPTQQKTRYAHPSTQNPHRNFPQNSNFHRSNLNTTSNENFLLQGLRTLGRPAEGQRFRGSVNVGGRLVA